MIIQVFRAANLGDFNVILLCLAHSSVFWDLISLYHILCFSFTYWQSLHNFYHYQIMVSIRVSSSKISKLNCIWMPSFIHQDVIDLIMCSHQEKSSVFVNIVIREHCTLHNLISLMLKLTTPTPLITNFMYILIPNCWFEGTFSP
jgi:hypothetical protein